MAAIIKGNAAWRKHGNRLMAAAPRRCAAGWRIDHCPKMPPKIAVANYSSEMLGQISGVSVVLMGDGVTRGAGIERNDCRIAGRASVGRLDARGHGGAQLCADPPA